MHIGDATGPVLRGKFLAIVLRLIAAMKGRHEMLLAFCYLFTTETNILGVLVPCIHFTTNSLTHSSFDATLQISDEFTTHFGLFCRPISIKAPPFRLYVSEKACSTAFSLTVDFNSIYCIKNNNFAAAPASLSQAG